MKLLFEYLEKGKNILFVGCLFLLFYALLCTFMSKENALDLKFAYSVEQAYVALGNFDAEERSTYRWGIWLLDMPYMIIYWLFFTGILLRLWDIRKVIWVPTVIVLLDFMENLAVLRMLKIFPKENADLASFASIFTTCKWIAVALLMVLLFFGVINHLFQRKFLSFEPGNDRI